MEHIRLGGSGLKVSRLALGCMSYGDPATPDAHPWALTEDLAQQYFRQAVELGDHEQRDQHEHRVLLVEAAQYRAQQRRLPARVLTGLDLAQQLLRDPVSLCRVRAGERPYDGGFVIVDRDALESLGMKPLVKTSGSKGIHIYVPIVRGPVQKQVWTFAKALAVELASRHPATPPPPSKSELIPTWSMPATFTA